MERAGMLSSKMKRKSTRFEPSSEGNLELRKPFELCPYCRHLAKTTVAEPCLTILPHQFFSVNNFYTNIDAKTYATNLKHLTKMKNIRHSPVLATVRGYPVTITDVSEITKESLLVKWCIHDRTNIASYEIYVDEKFFTRIKNVKRTSALLENVNSDQMHRIMLRVNPLMESIPVIDITKNENEPLEKCTCCLGRSFMRRSKQISENLMDWNPSTYFYSPNN